MNAAKQLKKMLDAGGENPQLAVLKALAISLYREQPFPLLQLKTLDEQHCRLALQLLQDWCQDQHADARSKLMERLFGMHPELLLPLPVTTLATEPATEPAVRPTPARAPTRKRSSAPLHQLPLRAGNG